MPIVSGVVCPKCGNQTISETPCKDDWTSNLVFPGIYNACRLTRLHYHYRCVVMYWNGKSGCGHWWVSFRRLGKVTNPPKIESINI
jgi:hypothetical protein